MRSFFPFAAVAAVSFLLAGTAGARPPDKFSAGKQRFRVEYTYRDLLGQVIGVKIYDCNGWVLKWGAESGSYHDVEFTPCP